MRYDTICEILIIIGIIVISCCTMCHGNNAGLKYVTELREIEPGVYYELWDEIPEEERNTWGDIEPELYLSEEYSYMVKEWVDYENER